MHTGLLFFVLHFYEIVSPVFRICHQQSVWASCHSMQTVLQKRWPSTLDWMTRRVHRNQHCAPVRHSTRRTVQMPKRKWPPLRNVVRYVDFYLFHFIPQALVDAIQANAVRAQQKMEEVQERKQHVDDAVKEKAAEKIAQRDDALCRLEKEREADRDKLAQEEVCFAFVISFYSIDGIIYLICRKNVRQPYARQRWRRLKRTRRNCRVTNST